MVMIRVLVFKIWKLFFLVTFTSLVLLWVQLAGPIQSALMESISQEPFKDIGRNFKDVNATMVTKDFRYILQWTKKGYFPFYQLDGETPFLMNNCSMTRCYVTSNRRFFGGDLTKFDAIAFNGRHLRPFDLPSARSHHQQYIYFNKESADNYPVCSASFEGFFNLTSTYRLDSDIPFPYILIRDNTGEIVGPKRKMQWKEGNVTVDDKNLDISRANNKTKAAAWFVSNCYPVNGRKELVRKLQNALKVYGLTVDVYGKCGTLQCFSESNCTHLLQNEYFFYMTMENSFDEDYVTEKLLTALQNDVVPIVYGGADYTRFLPPGSYIDARKHDVVELAAMMNKLMQSPKEYSQYFRWKQYYHYSNDMPSAACAVCEALHDKKMMQETRIYENFRRWWNFDYLPKCFGYVTLTHPRHKRNYALLEMRSNVIF